MEAKEMRGEDKGEGGRGRDEEICGKKYILWKWRKKKERTN